MKTERPIPGGQDLIGLEVYTEVSIEDFSSERPQALYLIEVFSMSTERPGGLSPCASAPHTKGGKKRICPHICVLIWGPVPHSSYQTSPNPRRLTGIALLALLAVMDSTCNKRDASS